MTGWLVVLAAVLGVLAVGVWAQDVADVVRRRQREAAKDRHPSRGSGS